MTEKKAHSRNIRDCEGLQAKLSISKPDADCNIKVIKTLMIPDSPEIGAMGRVNTRSKRMETEIDESTNQETRTMKYKSKKLSAGEEVEIKLTFEDPKPESTLEGRKRIRKLPAGAPYNFYFSVSWTPQVCQLLYIILNAGHEQAGVKCVDGEWYTVKDKDGKPKKKKDGSNLVKRGPKKWSFNTHRIKLDIADTLEKMGMADTPRNRMRFQSILYGLYASNITIARGPRSIKVFRFLDSYEHHHDYYILTFGITFMDLVDEKGYRPKIFPAQLFALNIGGGKNAGGNWYTAYQIAHFRTMDEEPEIGPMVKKLTVKSMLEYNPMLPSLDEYNKGEKHSEVKNPRKDMRDRLERYIAELNFVEYQYIDEFNNHLEPDEVEKLTFQEWSKGAYEFTYLY